MSERVSLSAVSLSVVSHAIWTCGPSVTRVALLALGAFIFQMKNRSFFLNGAPAEEGLG